MAAKKIYQIMSVKCSMGQAQAGCCNFHGAADSLTKDCRIGADWNCEIHDTDGHLTTADLSYLEMSGAQVTLGTPRVYEDKHEVNFEYAFRKGKGATCDLDRERRRLKCK